MLFWWFCVRCRMFLMKVLFWTCIVWEFESPIENCKTMSDLIPQLCVKPQFKTCLNQLQPPPNNRYNHSFKTSPFNFSPNYSTLKNSRKLPWISSFIAWIANSSEEFHFSKHIMYRIFANSIVNNFMFKIFFDFCSFTTHFWNWKKSGGPFFVL